MLRAIVTGAGGKMGGRIISLIHATDGIELAGAVEQPGHPAAGKDAGENLGLGRIGVSISTDLQVCISHGDVVIDFTSHEASLRHLEIAAAHSRAMVIGSTGFTADELKKASEFARRASCVLSPNMSVGVNVMFKVLAYVAGILGDDYDVEIMEVHHHLKKDAPFSFFRIWSSILPTLSLSPSQSAMIWALSRESFSLFLSCRKYTVTLSLPSARTAAVLQGEHAGVPRQQ